MKTSINFKYLFVVCTFCFLFASNTTVSASDNNVLESQSESIELAAAYEAFPLYINIGTMNPGAGAGMKLVKVDGRTLQGRTGSYWSPAPNSRCLIDYFDFSYGYEVSITIEFNSKIKSCTFNPGLYIYSGGVGYNKVEVRGTLSSVIRMTNGIGTINY